MGSGSSKQKKANILVVGLDNSGKTSMLNQMKSSKQTPTSNLTAPTVGYNVEKFSKHQIRFTAYDMSGQYNYRDLWMEFSKEADGIIFVIDSSDQMRFAVAKNELDCLLEHFKERKVPILFLANKNDMDSSVSPTTIGQQMQLAGLGDRSWYIQPTNAISGFGLDIGLNWLSSKLGVK